VRACFRWRVRATIIASYKAAPEFHPPRLFTRRAYLAYIKLIEDEFGDLPLAALVDRRVRGEFKAWRDRFANTPRKADFVSTVLARILSFAKDRGIISVNPCEKGGRLYVADRRDKIGANKTSRRPIGRFSRMATFCGCRGPRTTASTFASRRSWTRIISAATFSLQRPRCSSSKREQNCKPRCKRQRQRSRFDLTKCLKTLVGAPGLEPGTR
jgi:hypothetical protein